jgi:hypothetical protein
VEYQNRLREIRDLLFNSEQTWQLVNECAAIISDPAGGVSLVGADRAKWDYHPVMAMGGKAGQGRFYEAAPSHDFRGMVRLMKDYVKTRGRWIDANLLTDANLPATPSVTYTGPANFPVNRLAFHCSGFSGAGAFAAMKWRVGEVVGSSVPPPKLKGPLPYEVTPVWESAESTAFNPEIALPSNGLKPGHTYRVRVQMKNASGRWSHWSAPVQFAPLAPAG